MQNIEAAPAESRWSNGGIAKIVYIAYLCSVFIGWPAIVGVIVSHVGQGNSGGWVAEHYRFQIRTFWIGLLYFAVGFLATVIVIGWFVLLAALVWWIVRSVKGLRCALRSEPYPNVTTWLW